jgi:signal transduction histidine kinase
LGLVGSLRAEAERRNTLAPDDGPVVRVETCGADEPMPAAVEDVAYGIALEALNNAVRHAGARTCTIRVTGGEALQMAVEDDGCGLPDDVVAGVGLGSMHDQAGEIGGSCVVRPRPGGGTVVAVRLPW